MIPFPNIDPVIFSITIFDINLSLRWYAVSYILGFICAIRLMKYFIKRKKLWADGSPPMSGEQADSLLTYLIIGVILGGRLGYVLFYNFEYYLAEPIEVFQVWDGGMAFHGGFAGVVVAVILYCYFNKIYLWSCADLIAIATPPGLLFGRIANFINSELWGRPTEMPWGVVFPGSAAQFCPEVAGICARHPSQLYEALMEGLFLFFLLTILAYRKFLYYPGIITAVFIVVYSLSRFFVEYFRTPDSQFLSSENPYGFAVVIGDWGVTMGQCLSLPMFVFGAFLILFRLRRALG